MADSPEYVWSRNEEDFHDELGDVIDSADGELSAGDTVYRGVRVSFTPSMFVPPVDWIVDQMSERAYEQGGEWAEDWPVEPSPEACTELSDLMKAWADKHLETCHFFRVTKVEPYTLTEDDLK